MIQAIETNTKEELEEKRIGFFHDHCTHLYFGKSIDIPKKYVQYIKKNLKYIFIYDIDTN
jgi:hypothetical protein